MKPIQLYRFEYSTNVERVALALAHKGLPVQSVQVDPNDRTELRRISGQDLVPVIVDDGKVVFDSMEIVRYLENKYPDKPLYPRVVARNAEMLVFIDWFNRVWKRPPNDIVSEMEKPQPDSKKIAEWGSTLTNWLDLFESMLTGRSYLMGDEFSAADIAAFPFLKYALLRNEDDTYLFHKVLIDYMPLTSKHANLKKWIIRVDERPRV